MNKKFLILIGLIILIIVVFGISYIAINKRNSNENNLNKSEAIQNDLNVPLNENPPKSTEGLTIVPTMQDTITANSAWCGTFQLVWNDVKNELAKQDIILTPNQPVMATNLNKEEFNESMLSDEYYYKKYGIITPALKEEIKQGILDKFNQTSDILDDFDWNLNIDGNKYLFYTMLYRKFDFLQPFDKLTNDKFGNYNNIAYFGITDKNTNGIIRNQIHVLYYNSQDDFAIEIDTKTNDEVIFCKNPTGNTFKEIYDNMNTKASNYTGNTAFGDVDEFKAPNLTFNELREYTELEGKQFPTANYGPKDIIKALQTIQFSLNENGGEIKSEAGMEMMDGITLDQPRYFYVDNTFAIFLREKGKSLPYFAGKIDDITKFQ